VRTYQSKASGENKDKLSLRYIIRYKYSQIVPRLNVFPRPP